MAAKPIGDLAKMYQAVWRKALRDGKVRLTFPTKQARDSARFGLYAAVKAIRNGNLVDEELSRAVGNCQLTLPDANTVEIVRSDQNATTLALMEALGMGREELAVLPVPKTQLDLDAAQSEQNFLARMRAEGLVKGEGEDSDSTHPAPGTRVTPYYTR